MDNYRAVALAEGFEDGTDAERLEAWQYISDKGLWRGLQGFFGRRVRDLLDDGVLLPPDPDRTDADRASWARDYLER